MFFRCFRVTKGTNDSLESMMGLASLAMGDLCNDNLDRLLTSYLNYNEDKIHLLELIGSLYTSYINVIRSLEKLTKSLRNSTLFNSR